MAKIIVAAPPVYGEVTPLIEVARGLQARGHRVAFLTGSVFRPAVERAGLPFTPLAGAADYDYDRDYSAENDAQEPGPEQLNWSCINLFVNPMPDEHAVLQELLAGDPDQYLVANTQFTGAWPVRLGAPGLRPASWVAVSAVPLFLGSEDTTPLGPVPVPPGEDQQAANRAANAGFAAALRPIDRRTEEVLAGLGADAPGAAFIDAMYTLPDATAVLTVPGFEFERSDLPGSVHLAGALPAPAAGDWEPPAWWGELDGSRPVVVVTQGTAHNHDLSQLIEPALAGLAGLDVTVIAALGRDPRDLTVPVPGNTRVVRYVPFAALLPKASVLVTNGGAGGIHQALAVGVPVVVAGETEDKPLNAARVAAHRLGINLHTATPTADAVAKAVAGLLGDEEVRGNVRRLQDVYQQHDPLATIERLLLG